MEALVFTLLEGRNFVARAVLRLAAALGWRWALQTPIWLDARHTVIIRGATLAGPTIAPRGSRLDTLALLVGHLRFGDGPIEYAPVARDLDAPRDRAGFVVWGELTRGEEKAALDSAGENAPPLTPPAGYPAAARRPFCFRVPRDLDSHALRERFLCQWD